MSKNLSPAVLAQIASGSLRPALFLAIAFLDDTVYAWSGLGTLTAPGPAFDPDATFPYGTPFTGLGWLGQIQSVPQVADVVAQNVTLLLSGVPAELVGDAIHAVRQNSAATLWLGLLDGAGNVIGDPAQIFAGHLDVPTITEGAETCTIAITAENPLIDLNRAPSRRYTDVDQQIDFPGDTGFSFVQLLQDYSLVWPWPYQSNNADVSPAPPDFLTITPGESAPIALAAGGTQQLSCIETESEGPTQDVTTIGGSWWSSNPAVATVNANSGLVTAVAQGMCVITKRFVQGMFQGHGAAKPSNLVTASVTVVVTG
jgi:Bacterial Ig-like domain (group 2)